MISTVQSQHRRLSLLPIVNSPNTLSFIRSCALSGVALWLTLSCSQPSTHEFLEANRLITEEPQRVAAPPELLSGDRLAEWDLADPEDRRDWKLAGLQIINADHNRLNMRTISTDPKIIVDVDFDAQEVSSVEIELAGSSKTEVRLFWAGPSEQFSADRSIAVMQRPNEPVVRFFATGQSMWTGRIDKIRIDPTNRAGVEVSVGKARVLRGRVPISGEEKNREQVVKVDLSGDTRDAVLTWPGSGFDAPLSLSDGARLRFSLAFLQIASLPLTAAVVVTGADGAESTVFEFTATKSTATRIWFDHEVELAGFPPGARTITLEVEGDSGPNGTESAAAWANPEILVPSFGERRPNVLLISVDTLRAASMSLYGSERETTPRIDRWAATDAVVFENAIAPSPWTKPSHASIFTGIDALNHDVNFEEKVAPDYLLLAEAFREAGYRTVAVTGGGYLRPEWGFAQGFDVFEYWSEIGGEEEFESGLARLRAHARDAAATATPFFWFFHTYEVHSPYRRRAPFFDNFAPPGAQRNPAAGPFSTRQEKTLTDDISYRSDHYLVERKAAADGGALRVPESRIPEVVAAYDSGIAFVDAGLGELIEYLRIVGLYDDTIIVITSDHGEAFGEHESFAHVSLYEPIIHVPLIVKTTTTHRGAGRASSQVRSIDIAPTVMELAGLPPLAGIDGRSLTNLIREPGISDHREAWSYAGSTNFGVSLRIENRVKAIFPFSVWRGMAGFDREVFDLSADPNELRNVVDTTPPDGPPMSIIEDRLQKRQAGVRLRFENRFEGGFQISFRGKDAGVFRAKSVDLPGHSVKRGAGRGMLVTVQPGEAFDLVLDGYAGGRIQVRLLESGGSGSETSFELTREDLAEGFAVGRRGSVWEVVTSTVGEFEALVSATLESAPAGAWEPSLDDAHIEQLKALGYLQ